MTSAASTRVQALPISSTTIRCPASGSSRSLAFRRWRALCGEGFLLFRLTATGLACAGFFLLGRFVWVALVLAEDFAFAFAELPAEDFVPSLPLAA